MAGILGVGPAPPVAREEGAEAEVVAGAVVEEAKVEVEEVEEGEAAPVQTRIGGGSPSQRRAKASQKGSAVDEEGREGGEEVAEEGEAVAKVVAKTIVVLVEGSNGKFVKDVEGGRRVPKCRGSYC